MATLGQAQAAALVLLEQRERDEKEKALHQSKLTAAVARGCVVVWVCVFFFVFADFFSRAGTRVAVVVVLFAVIRSEGGTPRRRQS